MATRWAAYRRIVSYGLPLGTIERPLGGQNMGRKPQRWFDDRTHHALQRVAAGRRQRVGGGAAHRSPTAHPTEEIAKRKSDDQATGLGDHHGQLRWNSHQARRCRCAEANAGKMHSPSRSRRCRRAELSGDGLDTHETLRFWRYCQYGLALRFEMADFVFWRRCASYWCC